MSVADSTTTLVDQLDDPNHIPDIVKKLSEAMEENRSTEDHASATSGERNVGYTTNPPNKVRDTHDSAYASGDGNVGYTTNPPNEVRETHDSISDRERNVGKTTDPPPATCVGEDSDLFGGYTPKDTLGGGKMSTSKGTL